MACARCRRSGAQAARAAARARPGWSPQTQGAAPGSTLYVALVQNIDTGWHTYWRNPGDAGEPTKITWTLPAGWRAGDIVWPAPKRLPVGPLMNYGYEGQALLPVPIEVPADAKVGADRRTSPPRRSCWSAPTSACRRTPSLTLDVPVVAGAAPADPTWGAAIANALAAAPKPSGLTATYQARAGRR